ncbi:uncharacterized protein LOC122510599 [Leptopilina heterotoma]|uniref:uncharacterized protein LOC122510599 n=1 Tax=Leptopilina heterotoma TaxID=63436 RepID=UPI001CA820EC|nr:uncharacterized protein LOC122510599 [Leptopilina heterotoma]
MEPAPNDNTNNATGSALQEIPVLCITPLPEDQGEPSSAITLEQPSSGLVVLRKTTLETLLAERDNLKEKLTTIQQQLSSFEEKEKLNCATTSKATEHKEEHYQFMADLNKERYNLTNTISELQKEITDLKVERATMKKDLDSYEADFNRVCDDYSYQEDYSLRLKKLFYNTVSEVCHALANLREPKLRPKAPEGCLNCGISGHSFRSCQRKYNGRFCQTCAHPDFSTAECPWPHYPNGPSSIPESSRCKSCWQSKTTPNPHCAECRRRMIRENTIKRNKLDQELEDASFSLPSTSQSMKDGRQAVRAIIAPPASQAQHIAITSVVTNNSKSEFCVQSEPKAETGMQPSTQPANPKTALQNAQSNEEPTVSQDPIVEPLVLSLQAQPSNVQNLISPRESIDDNVALWESLTEAFKIGLNEDIEKN